MRREVVLALTLAAVSGVFAAVSINGWMSSEFMRMMHSQKPAEPAIEMSTVVVAKEALPFGALMTREKLSEAQWPKANVPQGAFASIDEVLAKQDSRVVLEPFQPSEPILPGKISGPGQRAGLATLLEPGKKAITIRINEVIGVAGFILPGDRVDMFVTNEGKGGANKEDSQPYTDLLLQNMRVLAIDQVLDPKHDKPIMGRTVTVEATVEQVQKITLAATIGTVSLALRESGEMSMADAAKRMTVAELSGNNGDKSPAATFQPTNAVAPEQKTEAPVAPSNLAKIQVVRATTSAEYSVPRR